MSDTRDRQALIDQQARYIASLEQYIAVQEAQMDLLNARVGVLEKALTLAAAASFRHSTTGLSTPRIDEACDDAQA